MKTYIKDSTLWSENSLIRVYESVSCMNADISNIGNNEIVFAGGSVFQKENNSAVNIGGSSGILQEPVIGEIIMYYGTTNPDPTKYLICDGSYFDRRDWPELYNAIGNSITPNLVDKTVKGIGANSGISNYHNSNIYGCYTESAIECHSHSSAVMGHTHTVNSMHCHCYSYSCAPARNVCHMSGTCFAAGRNCSTGTTSSVAGNVSGITSNELTCVTIGEPSTLGGSTIRFGDKQKPKTKTVMFLIRGK